MIILIYYEKNITVASSSKIQKLHVGLKISGSRRSYYKFLITQTSHVKYDWVWNLVFSK